ncbi:MAG: choice-of-anchor tandem repeat GloVer-containing protein, partial [Candidatus Sulfotelmatobacter sp.]
MPRILTLPRKLTCGNCTFAVFALCAATAITVSAQTLTTLHSFDGTDGQYPEGALVQAANGHLYGATEEGGANSDGTLFNVTRPGALTSLYSFCSQSNCSDGAFPGYMTLVGATNGDVYGTTINGGFGVGTVFKMTLSGAITTLYSFCSVSNCADGITPYAGLVQATNSDLYGTTEAGGANGGGGTVFKITPKGTLTTLYSFCAQSGCADGSSPWAGLVQATNGDLYGTTTAGGANGGGTVFKITPSGAFTTLYSFCALSNCTDGKLPYGGLIEASNGDLYGTTGEGGTSLYYGTIFKITLGGTLTTLY